MIKNLEINVNDIPANITLADIPCSKIEEAHAIMVSRAKEIDQKQDFETKIVKVLTLQ